MCLVSQARDATPSNPENPDGCRRGSFCATKLQSVSTTPAIIAAGKQVLPRCCVPVALDVF